MAKIIECEVEVDEPIYFNTDFIAWFRFMPDEGKTYIGLVGEPESDVSAVLGDQTQKILDAMGGKDDG